MKCEYCDHTGIHLCSGRILAYRASLTPEQIETQRAEMLERLERAIAASKELREKYGIEMVCGLNQKRLDYLESTDMADAVEQLEA